jgi:tRNA G18 (ribose-2'-O)-methylase SpoU
MFKLPYVLSADLAGTLAVLRGAGIRCVAAHPRAGARTLWETDLVGDVCVVLGAEGPGLRPEIVAACDAAVTIPMEADVDSLNVASAAAVCFAEVQRQRSTSRGS